MELFGASGSAIPSLTECNISTAGTPAGLRGHQNNARAETARLYDRWEELEAKRAALSGEGDLS